MIAKFNCGNGSWKLMECMEVLTLGETEKEFEALTGCYVFIPDAKNNLKGVKEVLLTRQNGQSDTVLYGFDAYLMNDQGDTIQAL